jgi:MFS transporter, DHA1 family, multidrug resistance protein
VMSLAMTVFMAVPVIAPTVGQAIVIFAPWRVIFAVLAAYGLLVGAWVLLRLPETLAPSSRRPIDLGSLLQGFRFVLGQRQTMGYALVGGLMFGAMFSFLLSAQQILGELYGLGPMFPLAFAGLALAMTGSYFLNSRLVGRLGMRRLSHAAVMAFTVCTLLLGVLARADLLTLAPAMALLASMMFFVGLVFSNVNALTMEPQGKLAGTASSLIGSLTTLLATSIGYVTGQAFDGTLVPLSTTQAVLGFLCIGVIFFTERGRFFGH